MYKGIIPFVTLQVVALVIVGLNPQLVNYLPSRVSLLSETAPPPRNPRLQYCVEHMLSDQVPRQEESVRQRLAEIRGAIDDLPADRADQLEQAMAGYEESFDQMDNLSAVTARIEAATPDYRPLHQQVSAIRREIARIDIRVDNLQRRLRAHRGDAADAVAARQRIDAEIEELAASKAQAQAAIPASWDEAHDGFLVLVREEQQIRGAFRQASERSYTTIRDITQAIRTGSELEAITAEIENLAVRIESSAVDELGETFQDLDRRLGNIAGSNAAREAVGRLRRDLATSPDGGRQAVESAVETLRGEVQWRLDATPDLLPPLAALEAETRSTLGLRVQDRFDRPQALGVASCLAHHRDISLRF
ncbi:hypothetical protein [Neoaquamicrobium sediminum]|nr:hypothetical protein [Mesorhizobium sediminum]